MIQGRKREIMSKMKAFPSMSGIAAKVLKVLDDPNSSADQVEKLLKQDPSLTANLLKLTNSAYFGIPTKVGSVKRAIVLMGWKKVTKLVMTACVNAITDRQVPGYGLPPGVLWQHSVAVSVTAEGLMRELKRAVIFFSARSPAWCPYVLLTCLKSSRSTNNRQKTVAYLFDSCR